MSIQDEVLVTNILTEQLGISFTGTKYQLGEWGQADNWSQLSQNLFLLLEVETQQKHPNTNVLKIWPYLEAKPAISIILVQAFFPHSPGLASSRGKLGRWVGSKMEQLCGGSFSYFQVVIPVGEGEIRGIEPLRAKIRELTSKPL